MYDKLVLCNSFIFTPIHRDFEQLDDTYLQSSIITHGTKIDFLLKDTDYPDQYGLAG